MDAEEFEAGSHGPVEERGLFEVTDAVGVEGDPVVAEEDFASDFGVDGVGVVEQRWGEEGEAGIEKQPQSEDDEAHPASPHRASKGLTRSHKQPIPLHPTETKICVSPEDESS